MPLPYSRSTRNQEHALSLAYAVRGLLNTRGNRIQSVPQLEAIEEVVELRIGKARCSEAGCFLEELPHGSPLKPIGLCAQQQPWQDRSRFGSTGF